MSTRTASLSAPPLPDTLAWVLNQLPTLSGLSAQARQNMASSIRRFCEVIERSPDRVGVDLRALEGMFDRASPARSVYRRRAGGISRATSVAR